MKHYGILTEDHFVVRQMILKKFGNLKEKRRQIKAYSNARKSYKKCVKNLWPTSKRYSINASHSLKKKKRD